MKKIDYKIILSIIITTIIVSLLYFLAKFTPFSPVLLTSNFDSSLPLIPWFVYFYIFWYLMLIFVPYIIYRKDSSKLWEYFSVYIIAGIIAFITFFFFPTTINRLNVASTNITTFILNLIYKSDTPILNCFPSMHVALCIIFIYYIGLLKDYKWYKKTIIIVLSLLVIWSTLLIKQHVIWDICGSMLLFLLSITIAKTFRLDLVIKKLFIKLKLYQ